MIEQAVSGDGHYLGQSQTLERMKSEYVYPTLADRLRREQVPGPTVGKWAARLESLLGTFGVLRLFSKRGSPNGTLPLPPRQRTILDATLLNLRSGIATPLARKPRSCKVRFASSVT